MVRVQDRPECAQGRGERSNGRFPGGGDETIVGHELQCASVEPEASIERRFGLEKAPGSEESQGQRPEALNQGQGTPTAAAFAYRADRAGPPPCRATR